MENTAKELENNNIVGIVGADDIDVDKLDVQSDFTIDKVAGDGKLDGSTFTFDASTAKSDGQNSFKLGSSMTLAVRRSICHVLISLPRHFHLT